MTTQSETIIWHKYPEKKPNSLGTYLVDYTSKSGVFPASWVRRDGNNLEWKWDNSKVIAWSEMPKGWKND